MFNYICIKIILAIHKSFLQDYLLFLIKINQKQLACEHYFQKKIILVIRIFRLNNILNLFKKFGDIILFHEN